MTLKPPTDLDTFTGLDARIDLIEEAPINVRSSTYGAVGDGATNADGAAIKRAALAAKNATRGAGSIYIPPGIYNSLVSLTATELEGISIVTDGAYNTRIRKAADVPLIDFTGAGATVGGGGGSSLTGMVQKFVIKGGLTLDGNSNASWNTAAFKAWFASAVEIDDLKIIGTYGDGLDLLMVWDSVFTKVDVDTTGKGDGTSQAVRFRSALQGAGVGTLGYSTDRINNVVIRDLKIENQRDGAIYIDGRNPAGSITTVSRAQRIVLPGKLKIESSVGTFRKTPIRIEGGLECSIPDVELVIGGLAGGAVVQNYIEAVNCIGTKVIGNARMLGGAGGSCRTMVSSDTNETCQFHVVAHTAADNFPSVSYFEWVGASNGHIDWATGFVGGDRSAVLYTGTLPSGREAVSAHNYTSPSGTTGGTAVNSIVQGDSFSRLRVRDTGIEFSDGTGTPVNMAINRLSAASSSTSPGELTSTTRIRMTMDSSQKFNYMWQFFQSGDTQPLYQQQLSGIQKWGPGGSTTPDTTWARQSVAVIGTDNSDISVNIAGKGLRVKEGSNAKQGTATLSGGTVVVSNTSVTASSRILLTSNTDGGTPGWLRVSARTAGTSFTITSSSGTDTSVVAWQIFEPA